MSDTEGKFLFFGFIIGFVLGILAVTFFSRTYYRAQAVTNGCGIFAVKDSTKGSTEFQWKKVAAPTPLEKEKDK